MPRRSIAFDCHACSVSSAAVKMACVKADQMAVEGAESLDVGRDSGGRLRLLLRCQSLPWALRARVRESLIWAHVITQHCAFCSPAPPG